MSEGICIVRMGGLGDLAMLSSSLQAFRKTTTEKIVLATSPGHVELMSGASYLDSVESLGDDSEAWVRKNIDRFSKLIDLRWCVEPPFIGLGRISLEKYSTMDRSDIFDQWLGVKSEKNFSIPVCEKSLDRVKLLLKDSSKDSPIIGILPFSKGVNRTILPHYIWPMANMLSHIGQTVLFGKTENWGRFLSKIQVNGSLNLINSLNIKDMVALCSQLDLVVSPDTVAYHIAAALGRKALALFGNIDPMTRTKYYPTVKALYPKDELDCIPCWDLPHKCYPTRELVFSECMSLLTPYRVFKAAEEML